MADSLIPGRHSSVLTMSSREIAELTGKRHDHVMRDIRVMLVELHGEGGLPNFGDTHINEQNGQTYPIFRLPRREVEILVTGYSIPLRAKVIDRLHELEAQAADPLQALNDPATMRGLLLTYTEKVIALEHQVVELKPKAAALERITASDEALTFTQSAKVLGVKIKFLIAFLQTHGWIYRQNGSWVGYELRIRAGLLEYKEAHYTDAKTGLSGIKPYCHITPKGIAKLADLMNSGVAA